MTPVGSYDNSSHDNHTTNCSSNVVNHHRHTAVFCNNQVCDIGHIQYINILALYMLHWVHIIIDYEYNIEEWICIKVSHHQLPLYYNTLPTTDYLLPWCVGAVLGSAVLGGGWGGTVTPCPMPQWMWSSTFGVRLASSARSPTFRYRISLVARANTCSWNNSYMDDTMLENSNSFSLHSWWPVPTLAPEIIATCMIHARKQ